MSQAKMLPKVLIDPKFRQVAQVFAPAEWERLTQICEPLWAQDTPAPDDFITAHAHEIEAILHGWWGYGDVRRFPKLRAIIDTGGTLPTPKSLDYAYCFANGIRVQSCSTAFAPYVSEMALGLALSASRLITETDRDFRRNSENWNHQQFASQTSGEPFSLYDKPVGFIGFGGLARALKPLLAPFRCPISVYDPWITETYLAQQGVTPVSIETLLETSRVIFVLATPSAENGAFLHRGLLEKIRPSAVFILISRASVVDFDALTELLTQGKFRAGIDVFPEEPFAPDHPIRSLENVVLTSHRAGTTSEAINAIGRVVVNDLEAILTGKIPQETQAAQPEYIRLRG
jgi:phosphoglycerate dehydrogenase-like enzyme